MPRRCRGGQCVRRDGAGAQPTSPDGQWGLFVGWLVLLGTTIPSAMVFLAADARLRVAVERCTHQLVTGAVVAAVPVPARVVGFRRRTHIRLGGVIAQPSPPYGWLDYTRDFVVLVVLPPHGSARRVGALIPTPATAIAIGSIHLVHLHPVEPEAAVLNVRPQPTALHAATTDERWATEHLPDMFSAAGGRVAVLATITAGIVLGWGCTLLEANLHL